MKLIERIEIKYFRSFGEKNVKITGLKDLNIFSGSNDVGKSNILKALNLFFNDEIVIGEKFDLEKDLSFLQRRRSEMKTEAKRNIRTEEDPYVSQRDLFVKVKIFFNRQLTSDKSTTPEQFWVEKTWNKSGFNKQTSNIQVAYKKKNRRLPSQSQAGALQGQLTQFLNSINFEYIPAVKDRLFLQYLFKKLQKALFERDNTFAETSNDINKRISSTTGDIFKEFKDKTGIDARFAIPESLIDFFTTINVSTGNGVSLYSRGDGIQARFIPAILNEISKGKKHTIWGFEEPENSFEYRNAELLAQDFLNTYSVRKQIFITSHTKEFLSLIKGNEEKVSLHRVYNTLEMGSLVETYKKNKGFNKNQIQSSFWGNIKELNKSTEDRNTLNRIFEDIGFLETDQYLIEDLQNQLKTQRKLLDESGIELNKKEEISSRLTIRLQNAILDREQLEREIEEYNKPILYVEDKYDQIYKISFLKINDIECTKVNFEVLFKENAPFTIRRSEGAGKLSGRLRVQNNDGYEAKRLIGLFDFDKEGRENIHHLKKEAFWQDDFSGDLESGFYKKRSDHDCFYAMLLPIPDKLQKYASLDWENFVSYVEIENLLPSNFLKVNGFANEQNSPAGNYLKIKDNKKNKIWEQTFDLSKEDFINFHPVFNKIYELLGIK